MREDVSSIFETDANVLNFDNKTYKNEFCLQETRRKNESRQI
jgi:hypothetical protein